MEFSPRVAVCSENKLWEFRGKIISTFRLKRTRRKPNKYSTCQQRSIGNYVAVNIESVRINLNYNQMMIFRFRIFSSLAEIQLHPK